MNNGRTYVLHNSVVHCKFLNHLNSPPHKLNLETCPQQQVFFLVFVKPQVFDACHLPPIAKLVVSTARSKIMHSAQEPVSRFPPAWVPAMLWLYRPSALTTFLVHYFDSAYLSLPVREASRSALKQSSVLVRELANLHCKFSSHTLPSYKLYFYWYFPSVLCIFKNEPSSF